LRYREGAMREFWLRQNDGQARMGVAMERSSRLNRREILQLSGMGAAALMTRGLAFGADLLDPAAPAAKTNAGMVSGYLPMSAEGKQGTIAAFKGIPYGADTRTTRFQAPKPVAAWEGLKVCTEWAPRAPQQNPDPKRADPTSVGFQMMEGGPVHYHLPPDEGPQSEDCLHVNVWTPGLKDGKPDGKRRPVLFYIHGGAYNNGTVNAALYDGTRLAERGDVVVVTVNHRLNAFGYLYLAGLPGLAATYAQSGNAGMLDLVLALEWVRDNIVNFGGDPGSVTIFGQSGGGAKCATLMAMPGAVGLFHRVLTMSGQQVTVPGTRVSTERARTALIAMGIDVSEGAAVSAAKLNALTMEQIQAGARTMGNWLPVRDDVVLLRDPFDPDAPTMSNHIPMILGNTRDEVVGASSWQRVDLTWEQLPETLGKAIQPFRGQYTVEEIVKAYRGWYPKYTPNDVFTAAIAAFRSWPGQVIEAERRASNPEAAKRTWVYQMDFGTPTADGRAPHTIDLAFVFDNIALSPGMVGSSEKDMEAAQPLATMMSGMLIEFARTGDPNGLPGRAEAMPRWPVYGLKDRDTMLFDRVSKVVKDPRGEERRMMVGARYRQPGT
jgi:para-nitrobenzyl esterase